MGRRSSSSSESEEGSISDNSSSSKGSNKSRGSHGKRRSRSRSSSKLSDRSRGKSPKHSRGRQKQSGESHCLSRYYREHFGSHSPEMYMNLRISGFLPSLNKEGVIDILEEELKKMAPFEIKVMPSPDGKERLAYLNFRHDDCAKTVRQTMIPKLQKRLGPDIMIDPAGVLRDQEGKFIPDRFNRAQMAAQDTRSSDRRRYSPPQQRHGQNYHHNNNNYNRGNRNTRELKRDDYQASRTLFVGNLPGDIRREELMKVMSQYGAIEDVDIKLVSDGIAAYAFVVYMSVDSAMKALKNHHECAIRPGGSRCQIGYGSSQVSTRLWIGGLGEWTTKEMLLKEFDRFGEVEQLEYTKGSSCAYIRFAEVNSASDACSAMKNIDLYKNHRIMVDYAKEKRVERNDRKRNRSSSPSDSSSTKKRKSRALSPSPIKDTDDQIMTYEQLNDQIPSTWKGIMTLKKNDYPLRLHRIQGRENLLQDLLRKEDGCAIKLKIDQRIERNNVFYEKLLELDSNRLTFMIGTEGSHSFTPFIEYLNEKKAVGMTQIGDRATLYLMPHCALAEKIVKKFAPRIRVIKEDTNLLLVILKSGDT